MADRVSTAVAPDDMMTSFSERMKEMDFVLSFVEKSRSFRSPFVEVWNESLENYLVAPKGSRDAVPRIGSSSIATSSALRTRGREVSTLKDPETNQIVESLAAQGLGLLMPNMEYIQAVPIGMDDPQKARFLSRLLMGILSSPGVYKTHYMAFKDAFIFGTAIIQIGWETRSRIQVVRNPVINEKLGAITGWESDVAEVVYRDAPLIQLVDIFDFYPDPSGTRIQEDMLGCAKRFRISKQEALRMADAGVYNREGVLLAVYGGGSENSDGDSDQRFPDQNTDTHDDYAMLTGFEFWGEVPWKPKDGARNRVITILNGQHVRSHINPFIDGNVPFKEIVLNPIAGRFYGLSPAETIRYIQDAADTFLMGTTDAMSRAIRDVLLVGQGFNGDPNRLARRIPGDIIPCGNPDAVKPLETNLNALQMGAAQLMQLRVSMREATGANSPMNQQTVGDRATATQVSELVRLTSARVELMVQLIEKDDYPWIGRTLHSRMRQFLSEERQSIIAGERFPVTLDDVDFEADVRFIGSRQAQSKFQGAVQKREAMKVLSDPNIVRLMPDLVTRYLRDDLDIKDAETIVQQMLQVADQMQQEAMLAEAQKNQPEPSDDTLGTEAFAPSMEGQRLA